jgi:ribosomal protein L22
MSDQEIAEKALSNAITFALYDYDNATKCAYLNGKNEFYNTYEKKWVSLKSVDNYFHSPRAISDINELIELRKANAELKKEVDNHRAGFVACMTGEQFTIHNLKQQAKGIELLIREETSVGRLHNGDKRSFIFCQDAKIRALELLGKVKALKEG